MGFKFFQDFPQLSFMNQQDIFLHLQFRAVYYTEIVTNNIVIRRGHFMILLDLRNPKQIQNNEQITVSHHKCQY